MKQKILVVLGIAALSLSAAFAYTPSTTLQNQLEDVVVKFEEIIDTKGELYRTRVLFAISNYRLSYSSNERAIYILDYLTQELTLDEDDSETTTTVNSDYTGSYTISDDIYGTEVSVVVSGDTRSITSNALPNHETGTFPNDANPNTMSAQDKSWELTTNPEYVGGQEWARDSGVAYNGLKFELETNERVTCESGETYRIEGFETFFNVMGIDDNNAHVQPTGEYHYHGVPVGAVELLEGEDIVHVGYASDGFPIYYSKLGTYESSFQLKDEQRVGTSCTYESRTTTDVVIEGTSPDGTYDIDWEYVEGLGDLDYCNGIFIDGEYGYFMTDEFPYGPRCMNGEYSMGGGGQGGGGQAGGEQQGPPPGGEAGDRPAR